MQEFPGLDQVLGNVGVEVCALEDGRVVRVKALTLRQASVWCGEARQAVEVISRAQEVRELAARQRGKALEAGDAAALDAAGDTRARAADLEAGYWARVERLVAELVRWGAVTTEDTGGERGRGQWEDGARLEPGDPRGRAADGVEGGDPVELVLAGLTAGQVNAIFEVGFALADPMYAVAGLRGALLTATIQGAARQVAEARRAMKG